MSKLILTKGLPASGKSTWAREYVKENLNTIIITKDDLRPMFADTQSREKKVLNLRNLLTKEYLKEMDVIWCDTNLNPIHEAKARELSEKVEIVNFDTTPKECIKRDNARANGVGSEVIWKMYYDYIAVESALINYSITKAIIVDIDGTIAHGIGETRKPYEWDKVLTDTVDRDIKNIVNMEYKENTYVFIVSGRDASCRSDTLLWLKDNDIHYDELHMRPEGDKRDDTTIKKEIYDEFIKKWDIKYVLDDRPRVIRMWKSLGLKVLNVRGHTDFDF